MHRTRHRPPRTPRTRTCMPTANRVLFFLFFFFFFFFLFTSSFFLLLFSFELSLEVSTVVQANHTLINFFPWFFFFSFFLIH